MLYISKQFLSSICEIHSTEYDECIWCNTKLNSNIQVLVGVVYRPPKSNVESLSSLTNLIHCINRKRFSNKLIMGEFNLPEINWDNLSYPPSCENFVNALLEANLTQVVHTATTDNAILDLIFTTEASCIQNIDILEPLGTLEHNMVLLELGFVTSGPSGTNRPLIQRQGTLNELIGRCFNNIFC